MKIVISDLGFVVFFLTQKPSPSLCVHPEDVAYVRIVCVCARLLEGGEAGYCQSMIYRCKNSVICGLKPHVGLDILQLEQCFSTSFSFAEPFLH